MDEPIFDRVPAKRLGDIVYESLVDAIASGRLPEGAKLYEDQIAGQMGVSKTPVREAFRRLEKDGFVEADLRRTPVVRSLRRRDIDELYRIREYLEPLAVRLVIEQPDAAALADLEGIQTAMEARFAGGERVEISASVEYNQAFHRALVAASGSGRLKAIVEPLWAQILRLSFLSHQHYRLPGKQARAVTEHRAILDAIRRGDAPRGETLIREHIRNGYRDLVSSLLDEAGWRREAANVSGAASRSTAGGGR